MTDAQGQFSIAQAPVGFVKLLVDGSTARGKARYPSLEYDMVTVAGQNNTVGQPIYLLPLNTANQLCVTPTTRRRHADDSGSARVLADVRARPGDVPRRVEDRLRQRHGRQRRQGADGAGLRSAAAVHRHDSAVRRDLQSARADYAARTSTASGRAQVTEMYSFDHDIGSFVAIGTGVVSDDGLMIRSSPGVGVLKAGWHCGGNPSPTGAAADCPVCQVCTTDHCEADPGQNGQTLPDDKCKICKDGSPTGIDLNKTGVEVSYKFGPPVPAVEKLNDALDKLKAIGVIASVNLLEIEGKLSTKECCEPESGKGKGNELSGSVTGDFGGFSVKGKIWPPGPIPSFKVTIDAFGLASVEAKAEFVGGVFLDLTGKVTGEIGYMKKDCSKDPADQAGCVFGKLELGSHAVDLGGDRGQARASPSIASSATRPPLRSRRHSSPAICRGRSALPASSTTRRAAVPV